MSALTLLWTEKPEWRQLAIFSTYSGLMSSSPRNQGEDFALEELGHQAVLELSEMMKRPLKVLASLGQQEAGMGYAGCRNVEELKAKARFIKITPMRRLLVFIEHPTSITE